VTGDAFRNTKRLKFDPDVPDSAPKGDPESSSSDSDNISPKKSIKFVCGAAKAGIGFGVIAWYHPESPDFNNRLLWLATFCIASWTLYNERHARRVSRDTSLYHEMRAESEIQVGMEDPLV